jgi:hypothetical protein
MTPILKYPRTPHITGSRLQPGDEDLKSVARETLHGLHIVVEEKLDGSNCAVSFDGLGALVLQSRGHVLSGGPRERQFDLLKRWAGHHRAWLQEHLGTRYIMYGEWLYARHTIAYDHLPHYFMEFDVLNRETGEFLSTGRRHQLLSDGPVTSVPVLAEGSAVDLDACIARSTCSSTETIEGLYLKHERDGRVVSRYKFVRPTFVQAVADAGEIIGWTGPSSRTGSATEWICSHDSAALPCTRRARMETRLAVPDRSVRVDTSHAGMSAGSHPSRRRGRLDSRRDGLRRLAETGRMAQSARTRP